MVTHLSSQNSRRDAPRIEPDTQPQRIHVIAQYSRQRKLCQLEDGHDLYSEAGNLVGVIGHVFGQPACSDVAVADSLHLENAPFARHDVEGVEDGLEEVKYLRGLPFVAPAGEAVKGMRGVG